MNLPSASGYSMPFDATADTPVEILLDYGRQRHPHTGQEFIHHGVDIRVPAPGTPLKALATGQVSALGNDARRGFYLSLHYPYRSSGSQHGYTVTYAHLGQVGVTFGQAVTAGQSVALSGPMLHMEVEYDNQEIPPTAFLQTLYANVITTAQAQGQDTGQLQPDIPVTTPYDKDQKEIEQLMLRFLLPYLSDIQTGAWQVPETTQQALGEEYAQARSQGIFYQQMPSLANPLGLGSRSSTLAGRIQTLLIGDLLTYLGTIHRIFLSSMGEGEKKKIFQTLY